MADYAQQIDALQVTAPVLANAQSPDIGEVLLLCYDGTQYQIVIDLYPGAKERGDACS